MVGFSSLRSLFRFASKKPNNEAIKRFMSEHRTFPMQPSSWQYKKFKDSLHYYFMLGLIPGTLIVGYCNVFIGPATLSEIPEGYTPKHWEYYRHPISRFIARYVHTSVQQEYEKYLCVLFMEDELIRLRKLEKDIKKKMAERKDYKAYYYRPVLAKYHRMTREAAEEMEKIRGT